MVNVTSSCVLAQTPLVIVQRSVTLLPGVRPDTVLTFKFGALIVTAAPLTKVQVPVPGAAALPAKVKLVMLLH